MGHDGHGIERLKYRFCTEDDGTPVQQVSQTSWLGVETIDAREFITNCFLMNKMDDGAGLSQLPLFWVGETAFPVERFWETHHGDYVPSPHPIMVDGQYDRDSYTGRSVSWAVLINQIEESMGRGKPTISEALQYAREGESVIHDKWSRNEHYLHQ